ncbi:hypothetical protein K0504_15280 [Neiella marina]|uniref:Uncharacterized protein n=1 Tax=Neiella holothuriorum TaxID=2870530 RepID=A0ABS7EJ98_9GAMM|nr:VC2046/SO_2500 family protein [Neiella holothuriorum]MBW8192400.1 hypothetical protein [Neiella holothuriorum]
MLSDSLTLPISNEYELGNEVNQAVQRGHGDTFRMLLALLSEDICDQPQFSQLASETNQAALDLRQQLQIADPAPTYDQRPTEQKTSQTEAFQQGGLNNVRLLECMSPEPLTLHAEEPVIAGDVLELLTPWQRHKIQGHNTARIPATWQQADQALLAVVTAA